MLNMLLVFSLKSNASRCSICYSTSGSNNHVRQSHSVRSLQTFTGQWITLPGPGVILDHRAIHHGKAIWPQAKIFLLTDHDVVYFIHYISSYHIPPGVKGITPHGAHSVFCHNYNNILYDYTVAPRLLSPRGTMFTVGKCTDSAMVASGPPPSPVPTQNFCPWKA